MTMHNGNRILHWLSIIFALLASSGLMAEIYLGHQGKSLCHTSACAIVAKFVRIGEPLLLSAGAGFFLILAGFLLFARRYANNPFITSLPTIALSGAAAFDGALLGFQFITLRQHCKLCITVALALGLVTLLYSASCNKWPIFLSFLAVWLAGFTANAILIMPDTTGPHSEMIFHERQAAKEFPAAPVATLIFSLECPHCAEVLETLAKQNPNSITWRFAITDQSLTTINKLGLFYANLTSSTNPFQLLLDAKKSKATLEEKIIVKLTTLTRQTRLFLAANGLHSIPVLVFSATDGRITIITGSSKIISFLSSL